MTQQNLTNLTLVLGFIDGLRATRRMTAAQAAAYMDGLTPEHAAAYLQYQDWGTPWTDFYAGEGSGEVLLTYAQQFYFGE